MGRQALIESVMRVKIEISVDGGRKEQQWGRVLEGGDKGRDSEGRRGCGREAGEGEGRGRKKRHAFICIMLSGFPFLNQSLSPTPSLTFKLTATVGNLNIKAAAVIDSCLLIFQAGPMSLHHRQSFSLCDRQKRDSSTARTRLGDTCSSGWRWRRRRSGRME